MIVGRNNCGKTSIAEVLRRLLADRAPSPAPSPRFSQQQTPPLSTTLNPII
ncbi:ATP-binding protein [Pseudomonas capsici]|uniref:ATP-binding protein n=1 Tax=Pseudomonas capsici TaxID=2810614 RepID=A0ABT3C2X5_9PSED|nr:ATP-binding protein [Pseudomonas capsici]MCV4266975.1 ATP-binding protein [Pseudomonas capsici]MCV4280686.1 ATP-binding protein [Pseudomonas capsici]MCV4334133.1 ATP-binding protein [Pseudomonas capsici]MCV4379462.1 ATP-binding protein [Pseudomonas capsici]